MTTMGTERWRVNRWEVSSPKCVFCGSTTEPTIVVQVEENMLRGWRCPKCGFSLMHPDEVPKAMELLKEAMKLRN